MFTLTSSAFANGAPIPVRYTCRGDNISPPLAWSGVPEGTVSLALIVDDPDAPDPAAPKRTFVHWVLYDMPARVNALAEGVKGDTLPRPSHEGVNDKGGRGYTGPCPPIGTHRYFHKLYALDVMLPPLGVPVHKADVERAMVGHVLATAELIGTFAAEPK